MKTVYFSSKLKAPTLFAVLDSYNTPYKFIENTCDIWVRDFMPVQTKSGKYVSFRYEPSYLADFPKLRTDYKTDIATQFPELYVIYSDINLDGGNVVFSPSKSKAIISDRIFSENSERSQDELVTELERLLEAQVIIIPALSLKEDMTGHADGMVRFVDENTVVGNDTDNDFEREIKSVLARHGIEVIDFPYFESEGISAVGCYINFLETDEYIFLPVFGVEMDSDAISVAERIFKKKIVPVSGINAVAKQGGVLNCISWEGG